MVARSVGVLCVTLSGALLKKENQPHFGGGMAGTASQCGVV